MIYEAALRTTSITLCALLLAGAVCPGSSPASTVDVVKVDNYIINPITARYIIDAIADAEAMQHECVVIELDTPGGLLEATRDIVKKVLNAKVPVVVYIAPSGSRAGSAGVFITMASNIAAMAPGTNIGAAHPVTPGQGENGCGKLFETMKEKEKEKAEKEEEGEGEEEEPEKKTGERIEPADVMSEKVLNDTAAWIDAIASYRGRNAEWAVRSVRESVSIKAAKAVEDNVVEMVCGSLDELLGKIDGLEIETAAGVKILKTKGASINTIDMNSRQRVLSVLSNPNIMYILFTLGVAGLFIEFRTPGVGFPGVAGAICLILAFFGSQTLPVNYAGVLLILLAFALFMAETMVISYGLLTLGGLVCMFIGSLMLIESPEAFMGVSLNVILPVVIGIGLIVFFLMSVVVRSQRRRTATGIDGIVGHAGVADSRIDPEGTVFIHGEIWSAESKDPIGKGEKVRVVGYEGLKLFVKKD